MRNIILFALLIGLLVGCRKTQEPPAAKMSATIGNNQWNSLEKHVKARIENGWLTIIGGSRNIELNIPSLQTGTYQVGRKYFANALYREEDKYYYSNNLEEAGRIIITEIDLVNSTVSGSFVFRGSHYTGNTRSITSGIFENVPITNGDKVPNKPELVTIEVDSQVFAQRGYLEINDSDLIVGATEAYYGLSTTLSIKVPLSSNPLGEYSVVNYYDLPPAGSRVARLSFFSKEGIDYNIISSESTITITEFDSVANSVRFSFDMILSSGLDPAHPKHAKGNFEGDFK